MSIGLVAGANKFQFKEKYDALKETEQKQRLSQPNRKIASNEAQKKDLGELTTLLGAFKGDIGSILDGDAFGKSKAEATGESASIETNSGVDISSFEINVEKLATKDAYQTNSFPNEAFGIFNDVSIFNSDGEKEMLKNAAFTITVGDNEFKINVDTSDSLRSISDKIINAENTDGKKLKDFVNVKVLDTGNENYRLMFTSKEPGKDNELHFGIVSDENNPNTEEFSKAALKSLGLLESARESKIKKNLENSKVIYEASQKILSSNAVNIDEIKDFIKNLQGETELKYKDENDVEKTFKIDKNTDISKLDVEQNKAILRFYKDESLKNWIDDAAKNNSPITITFKNKDDKEETISINDSTQIANLSDEAKDALLFKKDEQVLKDWVEYVKSTGDEINIDGNKASINKKTDFSKLSDVEKKAIREYFNELQEKNFSHKINFDSKSKDFEEIKNINTNHVKRAEDAVFEYDGVKITKSANVIDDLILGAKITLKKEGVTTFQVKDDTEALIEHFNTFATNYNAIVNNLAISTKYDKDTKEAGSLQGVSEINALKSELSSLITKTDNNGISLSTLGFELNEKGIITFKKSKFEKIYEEKQQAVKDFLQGSVKYEQLNMTSTEIKEHIGLGEGDFKINGKDIVFDKAFIDKLADPDKTVSKGEYLNKLVEAINSAKISGVTAKLGKNDNIIITSDGKNALEISGNKEKLEQIGLIEKTFPSVKKEQTGILRNFKDKLDSFTGKKGVLTKFQEKLDKEKDNLQKEIKQINEELEKKYDALAAKLNSYDKILHKYDMQSETINALINAAFANK